MTIFKRSRTCGFTLAEVLITCAVLAIVAAIVLPSTQPAFEARAAAAANEVAQALRFARDEAMRTGTYRMVACDTVKNTLVVFAPDNSGAVAATVNDPLTKMNYSLALDQLPAGSGTVLASCSFVFGKNTVGTIAFDGLGDPMRGPNSGHGNPNSPTIPLSTAGTINLVTGNVSSIITVDVTGRVTTS